MAALAAVVPLGRICALAGEVLLRAGGGTGGGHDDGGSSGGGFSGGGSGDFGDGAGGGTLGFPGLLVVGAIGFVVFVGFRVVRHHGGARGSGLGPAIAASTATTMASTGSYLAGTDESRLHPTSAAQVHHGLDEIRAHDPGFDVDAFTAKANRVFFVVQQAWTERDPDRSRRVMADGIWQQHRFQIEQYVSQGKRNVLEHLAIQNTRIVAADGEGGFDTIVVRFFASCADYDVEVDSDKVVRGSKAIEEWAEDWVFQRSSTAATRADGGTFAERCPNCGAPLTVDLAGICTYCKAPIMGGEYDWVLSRIEQLPSWEVAEATLPDEVP